MKQTLILTLFHISLSTCFYSATPNHDNDFSNVENLILQLGRLSSDEQYDVCKRYLPTDTNEPSIKIHEDTSPAKNYLGCFKDTPERMFPSESILGDECTIEHCINLCRNAGYVYAGLQWTEECYCGNDFPNQTNHPRENEDKCEMPCSGNKNQKCGGSWAMSAYATGNKMYAFDRDRRQINGSIGDLPDLDSYTKLTITVYVQN